MALAEARPARSASRLKDLCLPTGADWSMPARAEALERLRAMGLPERRDEYWKFTRPDSLVQEEAPAAPASGRVDEPEMFAGINRLKFIYVDGVFDPETSDDPAIDGLRIAHLSASPLDGADRARDLYGTLEARGQSPVPRPLAAMNTALATDGLLIHVQRSPDRPVHLIYRHKSECSDAILHHVIRLDPGVELTVLESGPVAARCNIVLEVEIAEGAQFHHVRVQDGDPGCRAATHVFARLAPQSLFKSFSMTANTVMARNECVIEMSGDDASAHVAGAVLGDGAFHQDDTVFITHDALRCESRQVFKKVLRNGATGVFQGKILVKPGAQKTDGYQISQALLLDDDSQFLAKPELEIYADDVACSHGSTSGAIDADALYYLRARGIPRAVATDLLTLSFLAEAVEEIGDEALRDAINARLAGLLARGRD